jgi:hypothetical protein
MALAKLTAKGRNLVKRMAASGATEGEINAALVKAGQQTITGEAISYYRKKTVVVEAKAVAEEEIRKFGVAQRLKRVQFQDERWAGCRAIIKSRKAAATQQAKEHTKFQAEISKKRIELDCADEHTEDWKALKAQLNELERLDPGPLHPGQETGLLVKTVTYTKTGKKVEWSVDTPLLREISNLEKHCATDIGEWSENHNVNFDLDNEIEQLMAMLAGEGEASASE